jgi:hypothetical protein
MTEHPYSYKPSPKFFGDGNIFLGLELEVEAPDYEKKQEGLQAERDPSWCYAKRDGSLSTYGWEMVTHPISMNFWMSREDTRTYSDYHDIEPGTVLTGRYKGVTYTAIARPGRTFEYNGRIYRSMTACGRAIGIKENGYRFFGLIRNHQPNPVGSFFRLVDTLKRLGYSSHDSGRCGFHVHVSRTAFSEDGHLRNPVFFRFKSLVNGLLFRKLSQRDRFDYCQQSPVDPYNFHEQNYYSRNMAVNITDKTVEVRLFRGNLREDRLRKNIEAVIAAIEFSKDPTLWSPDCDAQYDPPSNLQFAEYVRERRHRFPNLVAYIGSVLSPTPEINLSSDVVDVEVLE